MFEIIITILIIISLIVLWIYINKSKLIKFKANEIYIIDGDTFGIKPSRTYDAKKTHVRIVGYDSPEINQKGGLESKEALKEALSQGFSLKPIGIDKYNRILAKIKTPKGDVTKIMLKNGFAHSSSSNSLIRFAQTFKARINGKGIWSGSFLGFGVQSPKNFRNK